MSDKPIPDNVVVTPLGFISFPYLAKPDTGRPNSSGKYTAQLFVSLEDFKKDGGPLVQAVLKQGRTLPGMSPTATLKDFKHTIKMTDSLTPEKRAKLPESVRTGFVQINVASTKAPIVKDAKQRLMTPEEINQISGGDVCRFVVAAYTYKQQGGGVALGFNVCQFKEKGPVAFGGGKSGVELLDDLQVELVDDPSLNQVAVSPAAGLDALGM